MPSTPLPRLLRRLSAAHLAIALTAAGCTEASYLTGIDPTPVRLTPPAYFEQLWEQIEECSGIRAPMARVQWFVVETGGYEFEYQGAPAAAMWFAPHVIILADAAIDSDDFVRHEMLHDLLGSIAHPDRYFKDYCRAIVAPP